MYGSSMWDHEAFATGTGRRGSSVRISMSGYARERECAVASAQSSKWPGVLRCGAGCSSGKRSCALAARAGGPAVCVCKCSMMLRPLLIHRLAPCAFVASRLRSRPRHRKRRAFAVTSYHVCAPSQVRDASYSRSMGHRVAYNSPRAAALASACGAHTLAAGTEFGQALPRVRAH